MADDSNTLVVQILTDTKKAISDLGNLTKSVEASFAAFGTSVQIIAFNQALELGGKVVRAIAAATEEMTKFVLAGEQVKVVNQQFDILSAQAGLAGNSIREGLRGAADGLIDDTELIKSANKAFVELGASANKLPEILEIARKTAAAGFGSGLQANFEQLNQAIASGQTRQLRSLGIIVDSDKAIKDFARSIGVSVDALNQAGRQQAILNAVLEKAQTNLGGIDPNVNQFGNSLQRLKVSITEVKEGLEIIADKLLSGPLSKVFQGLSQLAEVTANGLKSTFATGNTALEAQRKILDQGLDEILIRLNQFRGVVGQEGLVSVLEQQASAIRSQLSIIDEQLGKTAGHVHAAGAQISKDAANTKYVDPDKALADQAKLQSILARNSEIIAETAALEIEGRSQQEIANEQFVLRGQALEEQFQSQKLALQVQARNASLADQAAYNDQILFLELQKNEKLDQLRRESDVVGNALAKGFQQNAAQAIAGGVQKMVSNLAAGKNAFADFGKFILGLIGDFAIQIGTTIIAAGIGYKSLGDFTGTSPIIFGAALVALGALLKSFAGSGSPDVGGGAGGGASIGASGGIETTQPQIQRFQPGTQVAINIQGNVLDRRESGLEIAQIIQDHFNNNGQVLVGT